MLIINQKNAQNISYLNIIIKQNYKMFKSFFIAFSLCISVIGYKVSDFKPSILKPSPPSGYHNVDTGLSTQGQILCFGDINGDQYNDYIAVSNRKPLQILIYFWNDIASQFSKDILSLQTYSNTIQKVQEIMLSDLSGDGVEQIIITYTPQNSRGINIKNYSTIAYGVSGCRNFECNYGEFVMNNSGMVNMTAVPTLVDLGNSVIGFLAFEGFKRYIISGKDNNYIKQDFSSILNDKQPPQNYKKVGKHFTSNVDFNGDCHADLVILAFNSVGNSVLQFYKKQANSKYSFTKELIFDQLVSFVTFIDFDGSGTTDVVVIMGETGKQELYILPNKYVQPTQICNTYDSFPYDLEKKRKIVLPYPISNGSILHFGDVNSDSYPDLLTIITANDFRKAMIFKNIPGQQGERILEQAQDLNANLIAQAKNPKQAVFFDLGEDGKIDILIMVEEQTDSDRSSVVTRSCFLNNVKDDTLFIKILPLSQTSTYEVGSVKLASSFGVSMQWRITKLDGNKKISVLNQKTQWNYGTLQLPFACGGLGRTNNYVQDLTVGYQTFGSKMSWSPIIPDSKLLIYQKQSEWKLQTLLANNQRVNQVVYVSVVILLVLGIVIFLLNYRENQEDKKDQYNFIQLIR